MPYIVDLLPPSEEIEAATALSLALGERKSKGLFSRKQYEPLEILARFGYPLRTVTWAPGATSGRCLIFDPQGLIAGNVQFALGTAAPELELTEDLGEEAFLSACQQLTKDAAAFNANIVNIVGLIAQPEQGAPLLDGEGESLLVGLEQPTDSEKAVADLTEQLDGFSKAAQAWKHYKEKVYGLRDHLAAKIQEYMNEDKKAGAKSLEDLTSQVETVVAAKRGETDASLAASAEEFQKRREMLMAELERFQEGYKETPDNYWRDQIKSAEKALSELEKAQAKKSGEIEGAFRDFEKQQKAKIQEHKAELAKHLAAFESRLQRLDGAVDGFNKAYERRQAAYSQQPERVLAATLEISNERAAKNHNAVFYAARYPGGRWKVLPPQVLGSKGLLGAVGGLFGGLNLPFKPASKIAETLAAILEKKLPGSPLEATLQEANLLAQKEFLPRATVGLTSLIDQGKIDKKHAALFAHLAVSDEPPNEEPLIETSPPEPLEEEKTTEPQDTPEAEVPPAE